MKNFMIICLMSIALSCSTTNRIPDYFSPKKLRIQNNFIEFEDIGVRKTPITNREYILFLCWNIDVYGFSYPNKVLSLLPIENSDLPNLSRNINDSDYQFILNNIENVIFKSYTLNPKYLDFPVIGLSKDQIFEVLKWLGNRYNEHLLINRGFLNFNPSQRDEDCYVLESYLSGQYQGDVRKNIPDRKTGKERTPTWEDLPFLPTFRMPYDSDLERIQKIIEEPYELKEYKFNKKNFLWIWDDFYLKAKKDLTILSLRQGQTLSFTNSTIDFDVDKLELQIGTMYNNDYRELKYFDEQIDKEKDIYGYLDFFILGENIEGRPISGMFREIENGNDQINLISWVVFNKKMTL